MDEKSTQAVAPAPQPADQQPIMNVVQPPKKRRTGLIIGIVTGSVVLVALIVLTLLYFLWWQNPQRMVNNAVAQLALTKKGVVSGKLTAENDELSMTVDFKGVSNAPKSSAEADLTVKFKEQPSLGEVQLKLETVVADSETMYVKVDGLMTLLRKALGSSFTLDGGLGGTSYSRSEVQMLSVLGPVVRKADGNWVKISTKNLTGVDANSDCVTGLMKKLQSNDKARQELADIYRKNGFLVVKRSIEDKNGARGFEIDLKSDAAKDKAKKFAEELDKTDVGRDLKRCFEKDSTRDGASKKTAADNATLKIWVDGWSHTLRSVELSGSQDGTKISMSFDLQLDKEQEVKVPTDAKDLKEVLGPLNSMLNRGSETTNTDTDIDIEEQI
ncbi:MAG: hypothetical protein Q4B05_00955 [Candidatus Saccharibacteria bacterium]|nr:hypothetical protein [Candidatus Saccharibacteria bacterium]